MTARRGGYEYGPRAALHWTEVSEVARRAQRIMAEHPRRGWGGSRQAHLQQLADDYGVTLRTLYRYLRYGEPVMVRVGPWTAMFAVKDTGEGAPVQLSGWIHDDEGLDDDVGHRQEAAS